MPSGRLPRGTKQKKRATMRLVYVDFWSALKMSFLVSIIVGGITVLLGLLLWAALDRFGVVSSVTSFLEDIAGSQGAALVADPVDGGRFADDVARAGPAAALRAIRGA